MITSTAPHADTDAELLDRAEQGDEAAFTALYRRYYGPTRRLAYTYLLHGSPDDLVDATFGEVVDGLRANRRPADSFGLYLFATLRRLAGAQVGGNTPPGVRGEVPDPVVSLAGRPAIGGTDRATIAQAFTALGERWQVVVWHTAVDGCDAQALAYRLGVTPAAAEAQGRRALTKLRHTYLAAQLRAAPRPGCHPHRERLAAYWRGALNHLDAEATRAHLDRCDSCRTLVADFDGLDEQLAWAVVPLFPFVAALGPASSPLAVGVAGHEVSALAAPESAPLPFRSATAGPRHMAAGTRLAPAFGRTSSVVTGSSSAYGAAIGPATATAAGPESTSLFGDGDPDDDEGGPRRHRAKIAAAAAAVVLLVGGLAGASTLLSGGGDDPGGVEVAADRADSEPGVSSLLDPDGEASTTTGAPRTTAKKPSTTTGRAGSTSSSSSSSSTSSSSSSSTAPSTTGAPSTSSSVAPPPSSTPATPAPPTTPTTLVILGPAPEVMLEAPTWRATDPGAGTLTVAVSRAAAPPGSTEAPSDASVALTIDVTDAVRLDGALDNRCDALVQGNGTISGTITCTVDAPALGSTESVSLALTVEEAGQQAAVSAEQDGTGLGTDTAELVVDPASLLSTLGSTLGASTG